MSIAQHGQQPTTQIEEPDRTDILRLAQESLQAWEHEAMGLLPECDFDVRQAQLRLGLSTAMDARRTAVALERIAAALEAIVDSVATAYDGDLGLNNPEDW